MKRNRKVFAFVAALAVLIGAWLLAEDMAGRFERRDEPVETTEPIRLFAGQASDIRGLAWSYAGETVELVWDEDRDVWAKAGDRDCPIDQAAVRPLVEAAANVKALMAISRVLDFAQYGLETPILTLTVTTGERAVTYELGNQTLIGEYYLRMDGENTVYTETGVLVPAFQVLLEDILYVESAPEDIAAVTSLAVDTDVACFELVWQEEASDTWYGGVYNWFLRTEDGEPSPLETAQAETLYGLVTGVEFVRCVGWHEEDLALYGLEEPQGTVVLTYRTEAGDTETFELTFGDYKDGCVYVKTGNSPSVYLAMGTALDRLMYPDWESMVPRSVCPVDMAEVTAVEVTVGGHTYDIQRHTEILESVDANGDIVAEETVYYVSNGWTLDASAAEQWFDSAAELSAVSVAPNAEGREKRLSIVFYRDSEMWPEVTMEIWSYDSRHSLCAVNGEEKYLIALEEGESLINEGERLLVIE